MTPARAQLVDLILDPDDAFSRPPGEIRALQLRAAQELFEERRGQIPLLGKRADDAKIAKIDSFEDLVPLLFTHTVYKSYPSSFFDQGRWDRMLRWLQTLSVADLSNVNIDGTRNVDDWLERLWSAGHAVLATSGSTGKCSFLNHTLQDRALKTRHLRYTVGWPYIRLEASRPMFWLGPMVGRNSAVESAISCAENWGRPGEIYALREPLLISEVSQNAAMRKKMADGTATPAEIQEYEGQMGAKAQRATQEMVDLADKILERRREPMFLTGMWAQHMFILRRARELGIGDGEFHPQTVVGSGGGIKGVALPPDYREQVDRFYGRVIRPGSYGMTEMASMLPRCQAGRYHAPPGLIMLLLDGPAEKLLGSSDVDSARQVTGRFGFLDLLYEGRWGGIITGDRVTMDYSEKCTCGRPGPVILDTIGRFAQIGEDDHIGCAGTIDAYIRGAIAD